MLLLKRSLFFSLIVFLFTYTPATSAELKLTASDGEAYDWFGGSVSISGDYAIVGVPGDDDNGNDSGSAYIFKRSSNSWTQIAKLTASDGKADDWFGGSVSISGDYAIVGATYGSDDNGYVSGSAYIFKRSGNSWTQIAKLTASDGQADDWDYFGGSVSISSDYAIVGAEGDDDNGEDSGSAYIFKRGVDSWTQIAKLTASDGQADDWFGVSVSISSDYAIVGAEGDDDNGEDSGSAYIFKRNVGSWTQIAKLTASDGQADDWFGGSVSISGNYVIVGAEYGDDDNGYDSGSAYIFERSGDSWTQFAKLTASDGQADAWDYFGGSVSISGDYAIVGVEGDDDNGEDSGSAYIFERSGNSWTKIAKLTASDGQADDWFGVSVSISGDYAIVGADYGGDDNGDDSGSAYVFDAIVISENDTPSIDTIEEGGCFIATAAFGSPMQPYVRILREFRDHFLLGDTVGNSFVRLYNTYSPPIANFIAKNDSIRAIVRLSLIPVVGVSWVALKIGPVSTIALILFFAYGLIGFVRGRNKFNR